MDLAWTAEQVALRHEFRRYLAGLLTEAERAELAQAEGGPLFRDVIRRLGRDGWLAPGWPVEYGGRGLDTLAQKIVMEELWWSRAPLALQLAVPAFMSVVAWWLWRRPET